MSLSVSMAADEEEQQACGLLEAAREELRSLTLKWKEVTIPCPHTLSFSHTQTSERRLKGPLCAARIRPCVLHSRTPCGLTLVGDVPLQAEQRILEAQRSAVGTEGLKEAVESKQRAAAAAHQERCQALFSPASNRTCSFNAFTQLTTLFP